MSENIEKKQKKVLHLLASNRFSGAENVVCQIMDLFKENDIEMIYCSPNGSVAEVLHEKNVQYLPLKKLSYSELKKAVKEYNPDIIHAHDYKASLLAIMFRKKRKIVSHIHVNNKKMNSINLFSIIYLLCSKFYSKIVWVSDSALDNHCFKDKLREKSIVLYNVINKERLEKQSIKEKCEENYDLIFLGRLEYQKNPERLIGIIAKLKEEQPDIKVAIVGTGEKYDKIVEMSNSLDLTNNIKFYGYSNNPYPILKSSKILILTSLFEGTPMCALEALALGVPVISTPVDGLKNIIKNNVNGFLTDDDDEMCEEILKIINSQVKRDELYVECKKTFDEICDLGKYKKSISGVYSLK